MGVAAFEVLRRLRRRTSREKGWETGPRYGEIPSLVAWNGDFCLLFDRWEEVDRRMLVRVA